MQYFDMSNEDLVTFNSFGGQVRQNLSVYQARMAELLARPSAVFAFELELLGSFFRDLSEQVS